MLRSKLCSKLANLSIVTMQEKFDLSQKLDLINFKKCSAESLGKHSVSYNKNKNKFLMKEKKNFS